MFVTNVVKEFYDLIFGKRVLVLVHSDLDAICSGKILQALFRADHILYTLCPVSAHSDLYKAVQNHREQVGAIILINCGGTLDLVEYLQLPPDLTVFVSDTHRPLHVCNIYSESQIRVLSQLEDDEEVPAFADIFREDESSDSEAEDETVEEDRARVTHVRLEKQRERRLWEQQRNKLLFDYGQFSYFAGSSATLMFELAWKLSKDNNDLLWLTIIALSSESLCHRREQHKLALAAAALNRHVVRLSHTGAVQADADGADAAVQADGAITFQKDVQLSLYRHWSLVESLRHTPYSATSLRLWTHKGEKRMLELLAELGLPLTECRQLFCGMDVGLRSELPALLESKAEKYGVSALVTPSFTRCHTFHTRCAASDYAYAGLALLESGDADVTKAQAFLNSSDCLAGSSLLQKGINCAKHQLKAVYGQVQTFLDMNQVISAGPFLYATVLQGSPMCRYLSGPHILGTLGRFTLDAHVSVSRNKKARSLPLVLTTPDMTGPGQTEGAQESWCLVCGVPPVADHSHRNFFGKAFEQAVEKTQSRAQLEFFDTHVIRLNVDDRSKFFDALISLLS